MDSNYTDNSLGRWIVSGCIAALLILACLFIMVQESKKPLPDVGPLMQLDYVVVETNPVPEQKKIPRIQPKKMKQEPVKEQVPEQTVDIPDVPDVPIETSNIPQPDISVASENKKSVVTEKSSPAVLRIGATTELDNTDFEPIYNPKPDYPVVAQSAQIGGYVDIDLVINEQGKVESFTIVETRGHPLFAVETAKVLPRWRFPPPRIGGKRVRVKYVYRVNFTLN